MILKLNQFCATLHTILTKSLPSPFPLHHQNNFPSLSDLPQCRRDTFSITSPSSSPSLPSSSSPSSSSSPLSSSLLSHCYFCISPSFFCNQRCVINCFKITTKVILRISFKYILPIFGLYCSAEDAANVCGDKF